MRIYSRNLVTVVATLALAYSAPAQENASSARKLSLREAIEIALRNQPSLASAQAQASAAEQQHKQAKAAYLPTLTLGLTTNDAYRSNPANALQGSSGGSGNFGTSLSTVTSTRQADLVLSYKLLDSGQRVATEQSTRASSRAATLGAEDQRQATIANAATGYYEVLRQNALVRVREASVQRAQSTLDLTEAQVTQGTQAKKDVYQAQADLATAKVNLLTAQNNLAVAKAQLRQALGLTDDQDLEPIDEQAATPAEERSLDTLLKEAYATRPDVLQAEQNVVRETANTRLAKANNGLTVSLDTNLSAVFLQNENNSRAIALTASLPLFNGGANQAAIRQAEETRRSTEAQLATARLAARVDVETAYRTLQTARAAVPAALAAQEAAQVNFDAASQSRKEGIGTVVDVITAQSQLVEAQTNYVQALYTLRNAEVALQRAIGHADQIAGGAR